MIDDATRESCALYALGLLEGDALVRFRARLDAGDAELEAELAPLEIVTPLIGLSAPVAEPSPDLKRRLFSRIGADGFYFFMSGEDGWTATADPGVLTRPLFIDPADRSRTLLVRFKTGAHCGAIDDLAGASLFVTSGDLGIAGTLLSAGDWYELGPGRLPARSDEGCVAFTLRSDVPRSPAARTQRADEGAWQDVGGGARFKLLGRDAIHRCDVMLARMDPGCVYPDHQHGGAEELFLLRGDCSCAGRTMHPGDYHRASPGSDHGLTTTETGCEMILVVRAA